MGESGDVELRLALAGWGRINISWNPTPVRMGLLYTLQARVHDPKSPNQGYVIRLCGSVMHVIVQDAVLPITQAHSNISLQCPCWENTTIPLTFLIELLRKL